MDTMAFNLLQVGSALGTNASYALDWDGIEIVLEKLGRQEAIAIEKVHQPYSFQAGPHIVFV